MTVLLMCTWCSSAKRENFNHVSHFQMHFVVRSTRIRIHSISCSLLSLSLSQCNLSKTITKPRASRSNTGTLETRFYRWYPTRLGSSARSLRHIQEVSTMFTTTTEITRRRYRGIRFANTVNPNLLRSKHSRKVIKLRNRRISELREFWHVFSRLGSLVS